MKKNNWKSPQAIIVTALIALIFIYIGIDMFYKTPNFNTELQLLKTQYIEMSVKLNKKLPEIDTTFKLHATQIQEQEEEITSLQLSLKNLQEEE